MQHKELCVGLYGPAPPLRVFLTVFAMCVGVCGVNAVFEMESIPSIGVRVVAVPCTCMFKSSSQGLPRPTSFCIL